MENNINVKKFYENNFNENEREELETLEFTRSKDIIGRYLMSDQMEIADICGATGAYSFWLANMGHKVHLLDLVENHIEIAKRKSQKIDLALASYSCSDARKLPYDNNSMDLVLLMCALYHLHFEEDRIKCLTEAFRILKPGGKIICTVISRYNVVISSLKYKLFDEYKKDYVEESMKTGIHEKANFYQHTPKEIINEVQRAGYEFVELIAVEGIGNALSNNKIPENNREADRFLWSIKLTESIPELIGVSRNIIVTAKKPL
jgi:ubiquinone/menaquinone biosynthesis C-methylase UbiE